MYKRYEEWISNGNTPSLWNERNITQKTKQTYKET